MLQILVIPRDFSYINYIERDNFFDKYKQNHTKCTMKTEKSNKQKYIDFINRSESIQEWLKTAPSQLLEYDVVKDQSDGLFRIRVLLKNSYLFDEHKLD